MSGPELTPAERIQNILGDDHHATSSDIAVAPLLSEMLEFSNENNSDKVWSQVARWIKFEEDVEETGSRFSKPHVGTLSLHALFELRSFLNNGIVVFDSEGLNEDQCMSFLVDKMVSGKGLNIKKHEMMRELLTRRHYHAFEQEKHYKHMALENKRHKHEGENGSSHNGLERKTSRMEHIPIVRKFSTANQLNNIERQESEHSLHKYSTKNPYSLGKGNEAFMRHVPPGAEAASIMIGDADFLHAPLCMFVRMKEAHELGDLVEVPIPIRFIFILMGPSGNIPKFHEVGRSIGTLLSDEVFREIAYKSTKREHLISGIDEFLDAVTVLPPGEWDPSIRIEPPETLPSQEARKHAGREEQLNEPSEEDLRKESGLVRSGRILGGLMDDIRRKKKHYFSDFKDAFSLQVIASWLFLYFGCLTPIVTFGGLLGDATENRLASMESLVSGLICGVFWGLFSGQPLTVLGSTGPVLVFEKILFEFCKDNSLDYLSFRMWTGLWVALILIIFVLFDISYIVCFITRFTEENFATLIGLIFMVEAFIKLINIQDKYPVDPPTDIRCFCSPPSAATIAPNVSNLTTSLPPITDATYSFAAGWVNKTIEECRAEGGVVSPACDFTPNVFYTSVLLFILTFLFTTGFKNFKEASFFPAVVRKFVADFSVILAIIIVTAIDYGSGVKTPKLYVPSKFAPTWSGRTWLIPPFNGNPWWTAIATVIPALLATILIFMDQQITAVIVNRRENKLNKGCGYHLDLLVL